MAGIFSGSISFVLDAMRHGTPFSAAVDAAIDEGLCEPDPREDLGGGDVRRKLVVLARELGLRITMDDVPWVDSMLPPQLARWRPDTSAGAPPISRQLVGQLKPHDEAMGKRVLGLCTDGQVGARDRDLPPAISPHEIAISHP